MDHDALRAILQDCEDIESAAGQQAAIDEADSSSKQYLRIPVSSRTRL